MAGKYEGLHQHLLAAARRGDRSLQLGFAEIDALVGGLPDSARKHRAWWSNDSQPHAWSWRKAGWVVSAVSQPRGPVTFTAASTGTPRISQARIENPRTTTQPTRPPPDLSSLKAIGRTTVRLDAQWCDAGEIVLDSAGQVAFPALPHAPGLYQMTLSGAPGQARPRIYIGETDALRRRAQHYRSPGPKQTTNIRLSAALKAHLGKGGVARMAVATEARIAVTGEGDLVLLDLSRKASRRFAENAALVVAQIAGDADIENLG